MVALDGERPVGWLCSHTEMIPTPLFPICRVIVDGFGVDPTCRRQQVGTALFSRLQQPADTGSIVQIEARIDEHQEEAEKFLTALNFVESAAADWSPQYTTRLIYPAGSDEDVAEHCSGE